MDILMDTLPWQVFKKIKADYPVQTVLITPEDINMPGVTGAYASPEEYVKALFRRKGFEVYRYRHDYKSIEGPHPQLGLVFMANDSVIVPGMEVHGLVGHNIRPLSQGESLFSDATKA